MNKDWFKDVFPARVELELDTLRECADCVESLLVKEHEDLRDWTEKRTAKFPKERRDAFYDFRLDDFLNLSETFPDILRSSLFVTFYSLLEMRLVDMCRYLRKKHSCSVKLEDLRERGISGVQVYLKKVIGISFPDQSPRWTNILDYKDIRNFVVHKNRRLNNTNKGEKVRAFINRTPWISLNDRNEICFLKDFYTEVANCIQDFFHELIEMLP